jgi:hypothetical protein
MLKEGCMRAPRLIPVLTLLSLVLAALPSLAKSGSVSPELVERARTSGTVRVVVQVDVPTRGEEALDPAAIELQRGLIREAVDAVLEECAGTSFAVTQRFESVRYVAIEASAETLAALEASTRVGTVTGVAEPDVTEWTVAMLDFGDRLLESAGERTLEVRAADESKAQAFSSVDSSATSPSISVSFDKSTYVQGDTIRVTEFRFVNPGASVKVDVKVWIKIPIIGEFTLISVKSLQFPANLDVDLGPFNLLKVSGFFPPKGTYEFNTRVSEPGGATLNEDLNAFTVQ